MSCLMGENIGRRSHNIVSMLSECLSFTGTGVEGIGRAGLDSIGRVGYNFPSVPSTLLAPVSTTCGLGASQPLWC